MPSQASNVVMANDQEPGLRQPYAGPMIRHVDLIDSFRPVNMKPKPTAWVKNGHEQREENVMIGGTGSARLRTTERSPLHQRIATGKTCLAIVVG